MPVALLFQVWSIIKTILFVLKEVKTVESLIQAHKTTAPGQPILKPAPIVRQENTDPLPPKLLSTPQNPGPFTGSEKNVEPPSHDRG